MNLDLSSQIEDLLATWYSWQKGQSVAEVLAHWYSPEDGTCREYCAPNDAEGLAEAADAWVNAAQSEQVQLCVDLLPVEMRAAIQTSMRIKTSGWAVWSSVRAPGQHVTYQAAKHALLPMLSQRGLIRATQPVRMAGMEAELPAC